MEQTAYQQELSIVSEQAIHAGEKYQNQGPPQTRATGYSQQDPVQIYFQDLKKYKLLTREEEIELARKVKEKDDKVAADRLITSNLRLVVKIAMDFRRFWNRNLSDLIQEGNLGLIQAVKKYDPDRGIKFSYYSSFWIKAYILKYIMENLKLVKIGTTQNQRKLFFNLSKERDKLIAEGFVPEPKLIAERLNVKEEEVVEMTNRLSSRDLSLNVPANEDSKDTYETFIQDTKTPVDELLSEEQLRLFLIDKLKIFRKRLSKREADIFDKRIMAEKPIILQELGDKYQISRERVRQIQKNIVEKLNEWSKKEIPNFEEEYPDLLN
jgi:RNA polymerase sigma-32 factor